MRISHKATPARFLAAAAALSLLSGCGATPRPDLPTGAEVEQLYPAPSVEQALAQVRLKPYDVLNVSVFQEPELGATGVVIDAAGNLLLPVVGEVPAAGKTPLALSTDIANRLGARYLRDPRVAVQRTAGILDRVAVTGAVARAGIYELKGPITLLDALTLAGGLTNVARRKDVAVIREIDGQKVGAIFDVGAIESGAANDPAVLPSDKIIVGTSAIRQGYRDLLQATPILGLGFRVLSN